MPHPKLVIVGGSLATGKSTLVRSLETELDSPVVSMDRMKESLFNICGVKDRAWSREVGRVTFDVFRHFIELHLARGSSVIAEATFTYPTDAQWIQELAERYGAEVIQLWLTADPRVARERFLSRAKSGQHHPGHCDLLEEVLEEFDERYFNRTFIPLPLKARTLVLDTTNNAPVNHDDVVSFVRRI